MLLFNHNLGLGWSILMHLVLRGFTRLAESEHLLPASGAEGLLLTSLQLFVLILIKKLISLGIFFLIEKGNV